MSENILDDGLVESSNRRRRDLLPTWIKVFTWIFMVFGAIVPIVLVLGFMGTTVNLALYGLETINPFSLIGILITILFLIKGVVAIGLWTEKDWAIDFAKVDAIIGIAVCITVMGILPFIGEEGTISFTLRFELCFLIPYFLKMKGIQEKWKHILD